MGQSLSGNRIAKQLGMSAWSCHRTLQELAALGLIEIVGAGRNYLFTMNREGFLAKELLLPLFQKEGLLLKSFLEKALGEIPERAVSILLFGSVARGDAAPFSGVDLLIVVRNLEEQKQIYEELMGRRLSLLLEFGNLLQSSFITSTELKTKIDTPLFQKIRTEGKKIYGKELADAAIDTP